MKRMITMMTAMCAAVVLFSACSAKWDQDALTVTVRADQVTSDVSPLMYGLMTEEINYSYDGGLYAELIRNRAFAAPEIYYLRPGETVPQAPMQPQPGEHPRRPMLNGDSQGRQGLPMLPGQREMRRAQAQAQAQQAQAQRPSQTPPVVPPNPNDRYVKGLYYWNPVQEGSAKVTIAADNIDQSSFTIVKNNARIEISNADGSSRAGIYNEGYWGIPVWPNTTYKASFYAKAAPGFNGPVTVAIESNDAKTVYASATVPAITSDWAKYELTLTTGDVAATDDTRFTLTSTANGKFWISFVSLFPPTYNDRPNGNRKDLMELMAAMHPKFLRFPGGNYLQGRGPETRFKWKEMIGPVEIRPTHSSPWNYHSSDGMGLLEFMYWCEDLGMEPILVVFSGMYLDTQSGSPFTGEKLEPYIQEALDEIEYLTGSTETLWGALRARHGRVEPFKLKYVELGNEDFWERRGYTYPDRYKQMYDAIKKVHPELTLIAASRDIDTMTPDMIDIHQYIRISQGALTEAHRYDPENFSHDSPKVFVGEYATREGAPTTNWLAALSDAAYLSGCERNADLVRMTCYAPIFVNVNEMQWDNNLLGYNAVEAYAAPSYYVQSVFANNLGTELPASSIANAPIDPDTNFENVFYCVTKDADYIYLKVINVSGNEYPFQADIQGVSKVMSKAAVTVIKSASGQDTNSIDNPRNIVPQESVQGGFGKKFTYTLEPYSVNVFKLQYK
ncbi:MAG: carbohydrate binding domain-containing protein [Bacteroidales bacterium]|nr:carbohydrate binding domain-containing protein [Bacteroidales bacterium]